MKTANLAISAANASPDGTEGRINVGAYTDVKLYPTHTTK
jgi:hypothetical protein